MAVRLDIRPRLTLPREPVAKVYRRPRLPPLTFPAVGYWLAMGALTYAFAHLDENPLQAATFSSAAAETEAEPATQTQAQTETEADSTPVPPPQPEPQPEPERRPALAPELEPELEPERGPERGPTRDERRANREAGRRADRQAEVSRGFESPEPPPALEAAPAPRLTFPEFTDSSRPRERERASTGPRIDSDLFGGGRGAPRPDGAPAPDTAPPESDTSARAVASSCEAAIARNREEVTIGGPRGPSDVTRDAYAGILENGRYLSSCSLPDRTVFEICAAVQNGRAVGVTVVSNPPNATLNACVRRAVSRLKFPNNSRLDVTHTRFDAARR